MLRRPMLRYRNRRRWPAFWRRDLAPLPVLQLVRHASGRKRELYQYHHRWTPEDVRPSTQPIPSALIRFALTGTTVANKPNKKAADLPVELRDIFRKDWSSDAGALPAFWTYQQRMFETPTWEKFEYNLRYKVQKLPHLHVFIQRHVYDQTGVDLLQIDGNFILAIALEHCQRYHSYQEILATINAIITRIENLGCVVSKHLHALALHYASLAFSAPAMRPHLEALANRNHYLKGRYSAKLAASLMFSLHSLESPERKHVIAPMRRLIGPTNKEEQLQPNHLYKRTYWGKTTLLTHKVVEMPFLAEFGMDDLLDSLWEDVKTDIKSNKLSRQQLWPIYFCAVCMAKSGNSSKAIAYLKELSELFDGTLPYVAEERFIDVLLEDQKIGEALPRLAGEEERSEMLKAQLKTLETRLGLSWNPDMSVYAGLSNPDCDATENPLFDMNGDSPGYDTHERLVAEIMALGCSKSLKDLEKIGNLLDDYEGELVPITTPHKGLAFAWSPERSPIKFSDTSSTLESDHSSERNAASSLGLARFRLEGNQISPAPQYPLRFIQLGRLQVRKAWFSKRNPFKHFSKEWTPTNYIVGWDRIHARFLLVFHHTYLDVEQRQVYMFCTSIAPSAGCLNSDYGERWFIGPLNQPLRRARFRGSLGEDPGLDLVE